MVVARSFLLSLALTFLFVVSSIICMEDAISDSYPLHRAAATDNWSDLKMLLESGLDCERLLDQDHFGNTPLHIAVKREFYDLSLMLSRLLQRCNLFEKCIGISNCKGRDILFYLLKYRSKGSWNFSAEPSIFSIELRLVLINLILEQVCSDDLDRSVTEKLLKYVKKSGFTRNYCRYLFQIGLEKGCKAIVRYLLKERQISRAELNSISSLMTIDSESAEFIEEWKNNNQGIGSVNDKHQTVLHLIAEKNDESYVQLAKEFVKNRVDIKKIDFEGNTALLLACMRGCLAMILFLISSDSDNYVIRLPNHAERYPIHEVSRRGFFDVVSDIFDRLGNEDRKKSMANVADKALETPLHLASRENHSLVVSVLLGNGASVLWQNANGDLPLHVALMKNDNNTTIGLLTIPKYLKNYTNEAKEKAKRLVAANGLLNGFRVTLGRLFEV